MNNILLISLDPTLSTSNAPVTVKEETRITRNSSNQGTIVVKKQNQTLSLSTYLSQSLKTSKILPLAFRNFINQNSFLSFNNIVIKIRVNAIKRLM